MAWWGVIEERIAKDRADAANRNALASLQRAEEAWRRVSDRCEDERAILDECKRILDRSKALHGDTSKLHEDVTAMLSGDRGGK